MTARFHVQLLDLQPDDTVPGRFNESGLWEIVEELGGSHSEGADVWLALRGVFQSMSESKLGERFLDLALLQPPIPAGCDALLQAMKDPARFPWRDHEVREDRFWLWDAHRIIHKVMPESFPAPPIHRVSLEVTLLDRRAKPPGKRTTARERTLFFGKALASAPGSHPIQPPEGVDAESDWLFDIVWGTEFISRNKLAKDGLVGRGATEEAAASGKLFAVRLDGWLAPQWTEGMNAGRGWTFAEDS